MSATPYVYTLPTSPFAPVPTADVFRPTPLFSCQSEDVTSDPMFMQSSLPFRNILMVAETWGGGEASLEVSPDGVGYWTPLRDSQGNVIAANSTTGNIFKVIVQVSHVYIRAILTGADGTTSNVGVFLS